MAAVSGPRFGRKCEYYSDNAAAAHIVSVMSETIRRHTSYCHRNEVVSKLREKFNKYFWPRDECGPKIKQFVAEARRQRHQQAPGSCLIVNWWAYKEIYRKFTRAWIYARIAVSGTGTWALHYCCLGDFPRWQHLHVRSGGAASRRKEILVVTHQPGPAPSHADNIQINFLFLMEFFTACKCLWDCLGQTADRNRNVQWLTIE